MKISVIIPTYNGAQKVLKLLSSLEGQTRMPDEVLVVIDGSTDDTEALLKKSTFSLPNFQIIVQENGGRSKVRNKGANQATGDLLVFFDDDMRAKPDCIAGHWQHHQKYPGSILTGGLCEEIRQDSSDMLRFKAQLSQGWNANLVQYANSPMPEGNAFITAANCSISKVVFDQLHGFDERLTDAEDYDFCVRAEIKKIPMYFNEKVFAWHDDSITCASYIRRLRQYAEAQKKLQRLKPELYPADHKYAFIVPSGLKGMFFKFFCHRFWISSIDKNYWSVFPQKIRFRLYDWVVTANGTYFANIVNFNL